MFASTETTINMSINNPTTNETASIKTSDIEARKKQVQYLETLFKSFSKYGVSINFFGLTDHVSMYDPYNLNVPDAYALPLGSNYEKTPMYYLLLKLLFERLTNN